MALVALRKVSKHYRGGVQALSSVDLDVVDGELFVIVGRSGSGKSTLLRVIAGLESPDAGEVWIGSERVDGRPPRDRDVAMVFQHPALYPYLSVFDNLAFGLRARRHPRPEIRERVAGIAAQLGLQDLLDRRPGTLSGGERQRVALGRSLVRQPRVSLWDEPLSSLDAPLRATLRALVIDVHRRLGTTIIHVTHDQSEALALGDRIAVMNQGQVVQVGRPQDVYDRPSCRFVAQFLGSPPMNVLDGALEPHGDEFAFRLTGRPDEPPLRLAPAAAVPRVVRDRGAAPIQLGLRPEHLRLAPRTPDAPWVAWTGARIVHREFSGHETIVTASLGTQTVAFRVDPRLASSLRDPISLGFQPTDAAWYDPASGLALADPDPRQEPPGALG